MADQKIEYVKCIESDIDAVLAMKSISSQTLESLFHRMNMDYVSGMPKEVYLIALNDELCSNREWVLRMFSREYIQFMFEIWDNSYINMDESRWEMVQYLKMFGFLSYRKGNSQLNESSEITIVSSMKKNFYFFLKSRSCIKQLQVYERWDTAFCGLSYYYGLISIKNMHRLICEALREEIAYEEFCLFIKCRVDMWGLGSFLEDGQGTEYFTNSNVENQEITYLYIKEHQDLPYKKVSYEDLEYIRYAYGIDNRWAGISDLGMFLVEEMNISYYRSTVLIHTMLVSIQNGADYEKVKGNFDLIPFENPKDREMAESYLRILVDNIPVYELKGHTRIEFRNWKKEKEWKNNRNRFIIIDGGNI